MPQIGEVGEHGTFFGRYIWPDNRRTECWVNGKFLDTSTFIFQDTREKVYPGNRMVDIYGEVEWERYKTFKEYIKNTLRRENKMPQHYHTSSTEPITGYPKLNTPVQEHHWKQSDWKKYLNSNDCDFDESLECFKKLKSTGTAYRSENNFCKAFADFMYEEGE